MNSTCELVGGFGDGEGEGNLTCKMRGGGLVGGEAFTLFHTHTLLPLLLPLYYKREVFWGEGLVFLLILFIPCKILFEALGILLEVFYEDLSGEPWGLRCCADLEQ